MTDTPLTLFHAPNSRSFAALWLLEELNTPYQIHPIDIAAGQHKQPGYLTKNPMGKVPLVMDGPTPVAELGAIVIYLGDRFPATGLCPDTRDPQRAAYLRWILFSSAIMEPAYAQAMFKWDAPANTLAWGSFDQMLAVLAQALDSGPWILGEQFSAADVLVGNNLRVGQMMGIIPTDGPIANYITRLAKRPAFQRAVLVDGDVAQQLTAA